MKGKILAWLGSVSNEAYILFTSPPPVVEQLSYL